MEQAMTLGRMLEIDLDRITMRQKDLVAALTDEGEPPLTEQALSNWKRTGRIPRRRLDKLLEILGPSSHVAKAHFEGRFVQGKNSGTMQLTAPDMPNVYPNAMPGPGLRHYTLTAETGNFVISRPKGSVEPSRSIRFSEVEELVKSELPEELRKHFANEYRIGDLAMRFDFISDNAVIEINRGSLMGVQPHLYRSLFRLAVAKKVGDDRRIYGLIVVLPDEVDLQHTQQSFSAYNRRLALEAQIMGLRLEFALTPFGAAEVIKTWAKGDSTEYEEDF